VSFHTEVSFYGEGITATTSYWAHLLVQRGVGDGSHATQPQASAAQSAAPGQAQELSRCQHDDGRIELPNHQDRRAMSEINPPQLEWRWSLSKNER
jgi:hypothetical protein